MPPPGRAERRRRARTLRRAEYLSLSAYFRAPIFGRRRRISRVRMFSPLRQMSISAGRIPNYVCRYSAFRSLGATRRAPTPRISTNVAAYWAEKRRRAFFAILADEIESPCPVGLFLPEVGLPR